MYSRGVPIVFKNVMDLLRTEGHPLQMGAIVTARK
jgi:hypothetical protein